VSDYYLKQSEHFFSCIMARTSCISMRWWLCTGPTRIVGFL